MYNMKRKKTSEITNRGRPCKVTSLYNEKTLLDFWKPKNEKKKASKAKKSKSRSLSQEKENLENEFGSKKHVLIKNPSKQMLVGNTGNNMSNNFSYEYKRKILFNEDLVGNLKTLLEPYVISLKKAFMSSGVSNIFDELIFNDFLDDNFDSLVLKFLMQISDDFLYVPISFTTKNGEGADKTKLRLFEGFNDMKFLSLQYFPSNYREVYKI